MPRKKDLPYSTEGDIFATRLRAVMADRGTNQTRLSDQIQREQGQTMQRQTISQYMNGQSKPDTERLTLLCRALNVSADYLLGLSDIASPDTNLKGVCDYTGLSEAAVEYIRNFGFILLKDGYFEAARGFRHAIMQTLNLLLESDEFVDIMLNLQRSRDIYRLTPDPEARGIDLINAEDMAVKVGFVILDRLEAAEHYAQKASLALHEFSTKTLRQFAEAEKEAATNE